MSRRQTLLRYNQALHDLRIAHSKTGCLFSISLVLLGVGLDYGMYPGHLKEFFAARLLIAGLTLLILLAILSKRGQPHVRSLTFLWLALPQMMIGWMIAVTDGSASIYFVGLQLAFFGGSMIIPVNHLEGLGYGLFTDIVYSLACYFHPGGIQDSGQFMSNLLFLSFAAVISAGAAYFTELGRMRMFSLQEQVAAQNDALQKTNTALAEVKGQLIQREKMAALGTLSAGLLHEVNNPVNYSLMAINMALTDPAAAQSAELKESLTDAHEGMQRVQNIVSDLKTFAYQKPGVDSQRMFLLEKAIQSALRLTSFDLKGIEVDLALPQDTHVMGDEPAIIGVLINLLSNAAQALHRAGREQPRISLRGEHRGGRLWLAVRDNGTGIAPENIGRVLEPFFTTRDVGAGLGLGLSVSYGIIQRHGGLLSVTSEFGAWTEFSFDLATPQP
ncbi:MAG TPA: two-component sensor histidine kinase [Polaromonas sp.]|uniref:sensor histidine kinase n=1 Tax=Polaromonas sp. UBA4122 TaxID=1947074 RepID=UPI000EC1918B|nr:ATP-binding protein [Polaromonas sp. UBA4122]HAL36946.1 two-component sensor histidine kinase [Polaromonas sp.]